MSLPRILLLILASSGLYAQTAVFLRKLESPDFLERRNAFESLAGPHAEKTQELRDPRVKRALVSLLRKENAIVRAAFVEGPGSSAKYGEGYSEYVAWVAQAVQEIAEADVNFPGIWQTLLMSPYSPDSAFARWLGSHGDRVVPFLMEQAKGNDEYLRAGDALLVLAEVVAYESKPAKGHRVNTATVGEIMALIRKGASDTRSYVRYQAVEALGMVGTVADLELLNRAADLESRQTGAEANTAGWFRKRAIEAAQRIRARATP